MLTRPQRLFVSGRMGYWAEMNASLWGVIYNRLSPTTQTRTAEMRNNLPVKWCIFMTSSVKASEGRAEADKKEEKTHIWDHRFWDRNRSSISCRKKTRLRSFVHESFEASGRIEHNFSTMFPRALWNEIYEKIRPTNTHFTGAHSLLPVPKEKKNELVRQETCRLIWSWKTEINNIRVIILHLKSDTVSVKRHRRSGSGEIYLVF